MSGIHANKQKGSLGLVLAKVWSRVRSSGTSGIVTALCLLAIVGLVFSQLHPNLIFSTNLPDGGDMGAHVYLPYFMRHYLLPQGRITGWSPGWYSGFPIFTFYFPLPSLLIALLSFIINYAVAFKLIVVVGLLMTPISAWIMAKLAGWDPPIPVAVAGATLPFLFERSFTIDGGNIASTMAGEYSFALSLSIGLILIGFMVKGLDTGRYRGLCALLFAAVAMCHVLPAFFVGAVGLVLLLTQIGVRRIWWAISAGLVGLCVASVWLLPFYAELNYSTNMGWQKVTNYATSLFPSASTVESIPFAYLFGLAVLGMAISTARWVVEIRRNGWGAGGPHRLGVALGVVTAGSAGVFILAPTSAVYNARALPFWFLGIYLLCGVALGECASLVAKLWRRSTIGKRAAWWWLGADLSAAGDGRVQQSSDLISNGHEIGGQLEPTFTVGDAKLEAPANSELDLSLGTTQKIALDEPIAFYEAHTSVVNVVEGESKTDDLGDSSANPITEETAPVFAPQREQSSSTSLQDDPREPSGDSGELISVSNRSILARYPSKPWRPGAIVGAIVLTLGFLYYTSLPLGYFSSFPGATAKTNQSFVPGWVKWNFTGYQGQPAWPEYHAIMTMMGKVGRQYGCGRTMWEYDPSENRFGTPMALMLLPYWTQGCIDSMEGLLFESSATTPYHFINQAELSDSPSEAMRNIPYAGMNVTEGIEHLQMLGVKYFLAFSKDVEQEALANPNLQLVAQTKSYSGSYNGTAYSDTWDVFLIANSQEVTPMVNQPVIMSNVGPSETSWLGASMAWYINPSAWNWELVDSGPASWTKSRVQTIDVSPTAAQIPPPQITQALYPTKPLPSVVVSDIHQTSNTISFSVNRTGVPVLVHTSYFPNWDAHGATGPYRAVPNLMVVIPTSKHVELTYGYSTSDILGWLLTLLGLALVVVFWRRPELAVPSPAKKAGQGTLSRLLFDYSPTDPSAGLEIGGSGANIGHDSANQGVLDKIFKAYDVRGTVPDQLDYEICKAIGVGFSIFLRLNGHLGRDNRVIVARDMRESGIELSGAFISGVRSQGVDVVDMGLASTDMGYFGAGHLNAPCAIFTASHNPATYNGIKFCLSGASPIGVDTGLEEIKRISQGILGPDENRGKSKKSPGQDGVGDLPLGTQHKALQGSLITVDVLEDYCNHVRSFVDLSCLKSIKVIADTANGMGGLVVPAVFREIEADLEVLYPDLDGNFPNHPADPIQPENLVDLIDMVRSRRADVGLAFDGDADRVFLVDETGEPLSGSTTTAMVAKSMLEKNPGSIVLHNLICSKAVAEIISENGGTPMRTKVGHSYIKAIMADTGAVFGGEHSGHYYYRDNFRADSGIITALIILEMMGKTGKSLSELRVPFERYKASGEINTEVQDPQASIRVVREHFSEEYPQAKFDELDGLTVDLGSWWFNLRPSNTEPLLRLNVEAPDQGSLEEHVAYIVDLIDPGRTKRGNILQRKKTH